MKDISCLKIYYTGFNIGSAQVTTDVNSHDDFFHRRKDLILDILIYSMDVNDK